jgi:hypothetical protein
MVSKHNKSPQGFIKCTKAFNDFTQTELCDNLVVSVIYYVSASLFLSKGPDLDPVAEALQTRIQSQSKQIVSSLYCQVLLSPMSGGFRVREERIFYETLMFFLDACACYTIRYEPTDDVYDLVGAVFRKGIPDPNSRRQNEFLPITEIVRRNWLSQRVPGKNRSEIAHSTLQGNTDLITSVVKKEIKETSVAEERWDERGFPVESCVPYTLKVLNRENLFSLPPPKTGETPIPSHIQSHTATRQASGRDKV